MAQNTLEDNLLRDVDISIEDNLEGMVTGSKSLTVSSENANGSAHFSEQNDESHEWITPRLRGNTNHQTSTLCQTRSQDQ